MPDRLTQEEKNKLIDSVSTITKMVAAHPGMNVDIVCDTLYKNEDPKIPTILIEVAIDFEDGICRIADREIKKDSGDMDHTLAVANIISKISNKR